MFDINFIAYVMVRVKEIKVGGGGMNTLAQTPAFTYKCKKVSRYVLPLSKCSCEHECWICKHKDLNAVE